MQRQLVQLFCDLMLILAASVAALWLRENFDMSMERLSALMPHFLLTLAVAVPILMASGMHQVIWRLSAFGDYLRVVGVAISIVLTATMLGFLLNRLEAVARSLPMLQAMFMIFAMVGMRVLVHEHHAWRGRPMLKAIGAEAVRSRDKVLVVGINRITELYLQSVAEYGADRTLVVGLLGRSQRHSGRLVQQHLVLGTPEDAGFIVRNLEVHGVYVNRILLTVPFASLPDDARVALLEVERSSDVVLDFFAERVFSSSGGSDNRSAATLVKAASVGLTSLNCREADLGAYGRNPYFVIKRGLDIAVASVLIVVTLPLMVLIALCVAVDIGLPTMFWQQRPGRFGVPFRIYKFRTMGAAHGPDGRRIPDAERSSVVGEFLRRFRLDELPQLWDILCGDMSFVGPRPLLPVDQSPNHNARLLVRPGLTGWAQINGGREITAEDKAALDIWYVRHASLKLDLQILALTFPMVIGGERIDRESIVQARRELTSLGFYNS